MLPHAPTCAPPLTPSDVPLCHCDHDPAGHELADCGTTIKPGRYGRDPLPGCVKRGHCTPTGVTGTAAGTCPKCKRAGVKVVLRTAHGRVSPAAPHRVPLERRIALVDHSRPGRGGTPCEGSGEVPAETRWTPPRTEAAAEWTRLHGSGSVVWR